MKRFALLLVVMVCLSLTAFAADVPGGDVFGGFSIDHLSSGGSGFTAYGWQASAAANIHPMIGIVGDFGGQYKSGAHNYQYLFGPRFNARMDKVTYFGEAFYGGDHAGSSNNFAMAYGGGVDVAAGKLTIRVIQFDWIPIRISGGGWLKNNTRYGFGVVMPFGKK
jgi:opacity protein-like surface antigen